MPLSNAERQRRHRERVKVRLRAVEGGDGQAGRTIPELVEATILIRAEGEDAAAVLGQFLPEIQARVRAVIEHAAPYWTDPDTPPEGIARSQAAAEALSALLGEALDPAPGLRWSEFFARMKAAKIDAADVAEAAGMSKSRARDWLVAARGRTREGWQDVIELGEKNRLRPIIARLFPAGAARAVTVAAAEQGAV